MPRYIIQRNLGKVTLEQVEAAGRKSKHVRESSFPDITWEHSHVIQTEDGMRTYCVFRPSWTAMSRHRGHPYRAS